MVDKGKVIITGGAGFVGSAIVRAFQSQFPQYQVIIVDRVPPQQSTRDSKSQFIQADITSRSTILELFEKVQPDIIIHTAGIIPSLSERYLRRSEHNVKAINTEGTRNVLDAALASGCKAFVYTSSITAVTDDLKRSYPNMDETWPVSRQSSIYGESKAAAEELVLAANGSDMTTCVLRPSVIFGEDDQQLIPSIHACIAKKETPYKIGDGMNLWDTVYVGNVADAHILATKNLLSSQTAAGEVFFIQNNEPVSFREFCLAVWKEFGHYPPFEVSIPQTLATWIGVTAEWYTWVSGIPTTICRGTVLDACAHRYASGNKARDILGYRPKVGLEEGLRRSCKDFARRSQLQLKPMGQQI